MTSWQRQFSRGQKKRLYLQYRDLYRQVQADAEAHGTELIAPLLPKSKAERRDLANNRKGE